MKAKQSWIVTTVVVLLASSVSFGGEPTFDGRSLSEWLADLSSGKNREFEAVSKLTEGEADAVPVLAGLLLTEESSVRVIAEMLLTKVVREAADSHAEVVEHLRPVLVSGGTDTKRAACKVLLAIGPGAKDALPELVDCLRAGDPLIGYGAVSTLAAIGEPSIRALAQLVDKADPSLLGLIMKVAVESQENADSIVLKMLAREGDRSEEVRGMVAACVEDMCESADLSWGALGMVVASRRMLDDTKEPILRKAGLAPYQPEAALALLSAALETGAQSSRIWKVAAIAIIPYGDSANSAIPALIEGLDHKTLSVRRTAAVALDRLTCPPSAMPKLVAGMESGDAALATTCARVLAAIGPEGVKLLLDRLTGEEISQRHHAAAGLGRAGRMAEKVVPALRKALNDPDSQVRRAAVQSLGELESDARLAVTTLIKLAGRDSDMSVRMAAIESLGRIGDDSEAVISALRGLSTGDNVSLAEASKKALGKLQQQR